MNQLVEVLTGADTENVRKWQHEKLSTYGIGKEHNRAEWKSIGRELVRLGLVRQAADKFNVLALTAEGLDLLKQRRSVRLTKPVSAPESTVRRAGEIACDEALFEQLRQLRKRLADERAVPPYIVFSDVALRQMARDYPANDAEFARISGVGQKKLAEYGAVFLKEIAQYLGKNPRQMFADETLSVPPAAIKAAGLTTTVLETLRQFRAGVPIEEIAARRGLTIGTVFGHLAEAAAAGEAIDLGRFVSPGDRAEIEEAFQQHGVAALSPVFQALHGRFDYGLLRLVRATLTPQGADRPQTSQRGAR